MKFDEVKVPVFGDRSYRGECLVEDQEQIAFFKALRAEYPETWGVLAIHPENEVGVGKNISRSRKMGLTKGSSDIVIPGNPAFVCEMKRKDHTQSKWQKGQLDYLQVAQETGSFACVALGHEAALEALSVWVKYQK